MISTLDLFSYAYLATPLLAVLLCTLARWLSAAWQTLEAATALP